MNNGASGAASGAEAAQDLCCTPEEPTTVGAPRPDTHTVHGDLREARTALVLLGTAAGPFPAAGRQGASSLVAVGESCYLIDAGYGALRKYVQSQSLLRNLQAVFVTHLHSDHVADLFNLFLLGWGSQNDGIDQPVRVFGPGAPPPAADTPPTAGTHDLLDACLGAFSADVDLRGRTSPRTPLASLIQPVDLPAPQGAGPFHVYEDSRIRVTATLVPHPPVFPSYAYRVETEEATIVFSGDTRYSTALGDLADGADILVHEAMQPSYYRDRGYHQDLLDFLMRSHTSPTDVGHLATDAGVRTVVLSHLGPPDPRDVADEAWSSAVAHHFNGRVVVGNDLVRVVPT